MDMNRAFTNDTGFPDEPFKLSDTAVIATLLAVGILLVIAISIGTWQCMKKSKPRSERRSTPFKRLRSSTRSAFSKTSLSPEQFHRLLELYHRSGSSEQDSRIYSFEGTNRPLSTVREEEPENLEKSATDPKNLSGLPFNLSPGSSVEGYAPKERLRQSADTSPGNRSPYPVSIFSATLLDISSPVSSCLEGGEISRLSGDGRRCVRVRPRNRLDHSLVSQTASKSCRKVEDKNDTSYSPDSSVTKSPEFNSEPTEQKPFYFAWPEEEEENHGPGWSPLCLKASMDSLRESMCAEGGKSQEEPTKSRETDDELSIPSGVSIGDPSNSSTPGSSRKGVVTSRNVLLPYGLKSTWV